MIYKNNYYKTVGILDAALHSVFNNGVAAATL
jgi:hypothetical protein